MGDLLSLIRGAVIDPSTAWVLFEHGTVVFLPEPEPGCDHAATATTLLQEWGPVLAGTPAGDFRVISLKQSPGWAVGCHHGDILTFISHEEAAATRPELEVGLLGRKKRDEDAAQLKVRHIEPGNGLRMGRPPLELAYRDLELYDLSQVRPEELDRFLSRVDASEDLPAQIAQVLVKPKAQEAGCLALLLRPSAEALDALWRAIDDDQAFHYRLVAVAACIDPEAVSKARKRLLQGELKFSPNREAASQRSCCLLEVTGQNPDFHEWIRTCVTDFMELCQMEWLHKGGYARSQLVSLWSLLSKRLPCLQIPGERLDLLEICWPRRWKGPMPSKPMRALLVEGKPTPLVEHLMGDGAWLLLEDEAGRGSVVREQALTLSLPEPYYAILRERIYGLRGFICQLDPGRWEIRRHGAFYDLDRTPLEKLGTRLVVSGINHDGKMQGATAAALKMVAGKKLEDAARAALAQTDRSLGTVVVTPSFAIRFSHQDNHTEEVAHVVSTPQGTPESPGWLSKAVPKVLEYAARRDFLWVGFAALGTAGGIKAEVAARLMIEAVQQWFAERPEASPLRIVFSLPSDTVYQAFVKELVRRRLHFTERNSACEVT